MIHIKEEAARCLLCEDAPCTKVCKTIDPARAIRAIRFDNEKNVWRWLEGCTDADLERAEQACIHYDRPIRIKELLRAVSCCPGKPKEALPSLAITFCGIPCENPFFLASSIGYDYVLKFLVCVEVPLILVSVKSELVVHAIEKCARNKVLPVLKNLSLPNEVHFIGRMRIRLVKMRIYIVFYNLSCFTVH